MRMVDKGGFETGWESCAKRTTPLSDPQTEHRAGANA
jgi:hypothetical protein